MTTKKVWSIENINCDLGQGPSGVRCMNSCSDRSALLGLPACFIGILCLVSLALYVVLSLCGTHNTSALLESKHISCSTVLAYLQRWHNFPHFATLFSLRYTNILQAVFPSDLSGIPQTNALKVHSSDRRQTLHSRWDAATLTAALALSSA